MKMKKDKKIGRIELNHALLCHPYNTYRFYRGSKGFMLAMSDARDRPVIEQDGYYIAPGMLFVECDVILYLFCSRFHDFLPVATQIKLKNLCFWI